MPVTPLYCLPQVDHCGHTHGVSSQEMVAKLWQMDAQVGAVVGELAAQAGPGQAHRGTLLVVAGDHGQTLGGDHGGGSPEEVDSVLVAVDLAALHDAMEAGGAPALVSAPCRHDCSCGIERNQCAPDLPQINFAPTLAGLLGVPIPFGNLGSVSMELWGLAAWRRAGDADQGLGSVLQLNAEQVQKMAPCSGWQMWRH